jgi:type I restriction enzyme S subunit
MELDSKYYADYGDLLYTWSATFGPHIWLGDKVIYHYHIWKVELSEDFEKMFSVQILKYDKAQILSDSNGSTMIHITKSGMENKKIFLPSVAEQKRIGAFSGTLDYLITLHQREFDKVVNIKKAMLEKMFPKNGENKPEIRFAGFTDAWEQRKLSDVKDVRDGTHASPHYYDEGYPLVTSKNLSENGLDIREVSLISFYDYNEINKRSKVDVGDILFGMIGTIGNPVMLDKSGFAIKNVALIKEGGEVPNEFLIQLLKSPTFDEYIKLENAGGTQKFLGLNKIRDFTFLSPTTAEQGKIGTFFAALDNLLTLHHQELQKLQNIKKSLLEKMFA